MSRPWSSVPSQKIPPLGDGDPGGSRLSMTSSWARSYGFCGEMSGAKSARKRTIPSSARPKIATGFATKSATIRRKGVSPALAAAIASAFCFRQPDPWIERRIQDVDQEVDDDDDRHDDEQVGDDHRPVEDADRVDQELAHARPGEDALGDDGESDQEAELQ